MELLIFYVVLMFVAAAVASSRGRSGAGWFFIALFISPLIALICIAIMPNRKDEGCPYIPLESRVRDSLILQGSAPFVRSHKPAFSMRVVHDVEINGVKRRFRDKGEAIAFVASHRRNDLSQPVLDLVDPTRSAPLRLADERSLQPSGAEIYRGIEYEVRSGSRVGCNYGGHLSMFSNVHEFRKWVDELRRSEAGSAA